jgi:hypothetical protein
MIIDLRLSFSCVSSIQKASILVRHGKLPHWTQRDVTYFVTFRLADSLPATKLLALREERDLWLKNHPVPLLSRKGNLWERESFDHIVRSPGELAKFEEYIRRNPQRWRQR